MNYTRQTAFSDPGGHAPLFDKLPTDPRELMAVCTARCPVRSFDGR